MTGYVLFLFIRTISFSISAIISFKVTAYDSADALASLSFLRVSLNYWVSNDVGCVTFDALVCPVSVDTPRDSSPCGYTLSPVREALSPRREILSHTGSRERYSLPSR